jgi:hypothetical protein
MGHFNQAGDLERRNDFFETRKKAANSLRCVSFVDDSYTPSIWRYDDWSKRGSKLYSRDFRPA